MDTNLWSHKHRPLKSSEIEGQQGAVAQLKEFVLNYKRLKKKSALVYGAVGAGKTASIYALASEIGYEVMELNASDFRDSASIESIVGAASKQMSFFSKGKIILVDEVDGLSGMQDRGGVGALAKVIDSSAFPIVLTANDPFDSKLSPLKKASVLIEFPRLSTDSLLKILQRICKAEGIDVDESVLRSLARRCGGDARALINDLQTLAMHSGKLSKEDIESLSSRNQDEEIVLALNKILKNTDLEIALNALDSVDEDTNKAFLWVDENMPKEYKLAEDLAGAYESISKADVFAGRIRRWQHWRFLVYIYAFLTGGVAISKKRKYEGVPSYSQPSRLLKIWIGNSRNAKKKGIASKIATKTNESLKKTVRLTMPYLRIICRDHAAAKRIAAEFELTDEETEWLSAV